MCFPNAANEAAKCRAQARSFTGSERKLLLNIADAFEKLAPQTCGKEEFDRQ